MRVDNVDNIFKYEDVPVRTPLGGVVIKRNITPATVVQAGTEAFVVTNLSTVWVTGSVSERDISLVRIGNPVTVKVQGYPDEIFIVVLLIFLGDWRAALVVALTIPLSLLFGFMGMKWFGISANLMSLGAIDFPTNQSQGRRLRMEVEMDTRACYELRSLLPLGGTLLQVI